MRIYWTLICLLSCFLFIPEIYGNPINATGVRAPVLDDDFIFGLMAGIFPFIIVGAIAYLAFKGFFSRKTGGRDFS